MEEVRMKSMRGAVFDMDGLMLDTERVSRLAFDYAGEMTGVGKAGYLTVRMLGLSPQASSEILYREYGEAYREEEFRRYADEFRARYFAEHGIPKKPGLLDVLERLSSSGLRLAVASSTKRETVLSQLTDAGAVGFFDAVVCGDMVERYKPEPDIYLRACELLGLSPCECWALDDAPAGVASAHAAGCRVIMIPDLMMPDAECLASAELVCRDLSEAAEHILSDGG